MLDQAPSCHKDLCTCSRAEVLNALLWLKKVVLMTEGTSTLDLLKVTCSTSVVKVTAAMSSGGQISLNRILPAVALRKAQSCLWSDEGSAQGQEGYQLLHSRSAARLQSVLSSGKPNGEPVEADHIQVKWQRKRTGCVLMVRPGVSPGTTVRWRHPEAAILGMAVAPAQSCRP
jgi:hypothetical protein